MQIVLIDFENTQPKDLHQLPSLQCLVRVFVGRFQRKVPLDVLESLQPLGKSVEYVRVEHAGKNALDFLLILHLGELASVHPAGHFWIVSKDGDFDSVVKHLRNRKIACDRVTSIEQIAPKRDESAEQVMKVARYLAKLNGSTPRRLKTLRGAIRGLLGAVSEADVDRVVEALKTAGLVAETDGKLKYSCSMAGVASAGVRP
jgi:PIN domain